MLHAPCILRLTSYLSFITPCCIAAYFIRHLSLITPYLRSCELVTHCALLHCSLLITYYTLHHYTLHITPLHHYTITHYTLHLTPYTLDSSPGVYQYSMSMLLTFYVLRHTYHLSLHTSPLTHYAVLANLLLRASRLLLLAYCFLLLTSYILHRPCIIHHPSSTLHHQSTMRPCVHHPSYILCHLYIVLDRPSSIVHPSIVHRVSFFSSCFMLDVHS